MCYQIIEIGFEDISQIKTLWEKLNRIHFEDSQYFKEYYEMQVFERRIEKFRLIEKDNIFIRLVKENGRALGYCVTTISSDGSLGEIESLFVEQEVRGDGIGKKLVVEAVDWLKKKNCKRITVGVADGHESVFKFYKKQGFFPRLTYLDLKEQEI